MPAITLASQVIGFISFSITLTLLLGVYRDLISTLRKADTHIPIILGNLRQELIFEKALTGHKLEVGDEFEVFTHKLRYLRGAAGKRDRTRHRFAELIDVTIKELWIEFKRLERPFLIRSGMRAEEVRRGEYWSEDDLKEKGSRRRGGRLSRRRGERDGVVPSEIELRRAEEGIREQGRQYYRTDLAHRWIWWQSKSDIERLADQVQRIQIRRMERDLYETDELVKILVRRGEGGRGAGGGEGRGGSGDSSPSSSGSGGGGKRRRNSVIVRSRAGSVRSVRMPSRTRSVVGRNMREVDEREVIRRPARSPGRRGQPEMEASNTGRRRDRRDSTVEYEVLRPGSVYVETVDRPRSVYGAERRTSYSRERR